MYDNDKDPLFFTGLSVHRVRTIKIVHSARHKLVDVTFIADNGQDFSVSAWGGYPQYRPEVVIEADNTIDAVKEDDSTIEAEAAE